MLTYNNKVILAPMVRIGTLPMRLLALEFGADIVYSEEIIDHRLLKCQRVENNVLGTVDYIDEDSDIIFRTCAKEKKHIVLQLGTCCPDRALKAAQFVENDVAGIDINMGCPKEFSIKGGMGAALLTQPEKIRAILTNLTKNLSCPVTCKIRVLPEVEDTVSLAKLIESTGVSALAVHGRTRVERPQHKNRNYVIRAVTEAVNIPIIANGGSSEIDCYKDIDKFRQITGASSVMIARQAKWDCSIFRENGKLPIDDVISAYIKNAVDFDNNVWNTKYCIQQMLGSFPDTDKVKALLGAHQMEVICDLWNLRDYFDTKQKEIGYLAEKVKRLQDTDSELQSNLKRRRVMDINVYEMDVKFLRPLFSMDGLPKTVLCRWTLINKFDLPSYQTKQYEKSFQSIVTVQGKKYANRCLEKNKKYSEQAAALVACLALHLIDSCNVKINEITDATYISSQSKNLDNSSVANADAANYNS